MKVGNSNTESLVVRLNSAEPEVNAAAVATTMYAVVTILSEAQRQITDKEQLIIKARPFAMGSFEIPLDLIAITTADLFAINPLINNVLDTLLKYFQVKAALKGSPPPTEDGTSVKFEDCDITIGNITINLLRPTSLANKEVSEAFNEIERDESITSVQILRGVDRKPLVTVPRAEFPHYKLPEEEGELSKQRDIHSRETLTIASIVFEGRANWRFNRGGHIIPARMADKDFSERVNRGVEMFRAGDRLDVELVIHQKFDDATNDYVNKSYAISHVWGHEKRKKQQNLIDGH